ncbi:MAG: hypothetical protein CFE31_18900 [Rhizobiales bacterium PAR1]|nr:MAG: hypothetical protein CFE31_18900 [Rhizobiales bacterium PAR1]
MTASADPRWTTVLERTHDAVLAFARAEWPPLARKAIHQLQRMTATGLYGDYYRHKTLWDEYCHEVQNGPAPLLDGAWDSTVDGILASILDAVPEHVAVLLTIDAIVDCDPREQSSLAGLVFQDELIRVLRKELQIMAHERSMAKFEPENS